MYGIGGKIDRCALTFFRNTTHPVSETHGWRGFAWFLYQGLGSQGFAPSRMLVLIFARRSVYYLGNVQAATFRITLTLKSRTTGVLYLDRRHISGRPRRFGERLCS